MLASPFFPFLAALDNKFITKKRLKVHSNLLIKTFHNFAWKTAILVDNYSQCKDLFKPPSWKAIWDRVRVWTHLPWIFLLDHLVDLFLSLISIMIIFFFSFTCLSCDFHQNNGKKQGIDIFLTQGTHHGISLFSYIIKLTCFSHWFNNDNNHPSL